MNRISLGFIKWKVVYLTFLIWVLEEASGTHAGNLRRKVDRRYKSN